MNYLVDTHIFLWSLFSPKKLPLGARKILLSPQDVKYVSVVTFWEIALKYQLKKITLEGVLPDGLPSLAKNAGFEILDLDSNTTSSFYKLPRFTNKDPFDRMLAWQAISYDHYLLTKDKEFVGYKQYGLKIT